MDVRWQYEPLTVRAVLDRLDTGKPLAYTTVMTVMTVMDSLHRKSWVSRERDGRAYHYRPACSRAEAAAQALGAVLDSSGDPEAVLLHFARSVSNQESDVLYKALRRARRTLFRVDERAGVAVEDRALAGLARSVLDVVAVAVEQALGAV
jgi:predicted transcriptional regulator